MIASWPWLGSACVSLPVHQFLTSCVHSGGPACQPEDWSRPGAAAAAAAAAVSRLCLLRSRTNCHMSARVYTMAGTRPKIEKIVRKTDTKFSDRLSLASSSVLCRGKLLGKGHCQLVCCFEYNFLLLVPSFKRLKPRERLKQFGGRGFLLWLVRHVC